jgi:uncharacterized membrane protein YeaQ/YmgE (transglycosylase-associated protein family)
VNVVLYVIAIALSGLIVGALARLLLPGRDPMSIFATILVGIGGSLIAGLVVRYLFDSEAGPGFLLSVLCALLIVFVVRKVRERQMREVPQTTRSGLLG